MSSELMLEIGEIAKRDERAIRAVLLDIVSEHDEVDELVQDTLLRCVEKADSFDPEQSSLLTWVCNVAKNVAKNYLRDKARQPELVVEAEMSLGEDEYGSISYDEMYFAADPCDEPGLEAEADDLLVEALTRMPRQMAACVHLRYEGHSNDEVAEELGITEKTVRNLISESRVYFDTD